MKVTVEVGCTPEEAAASLAYPTSSPCSRRQWRNRSSAKESAVEASTPEALLKAWMPMAPDQMQQAFAKLFGAFGGAKARDRG
jgi:hypothetical protein